METHRVCLHIYAGYRLTGTMTTLRSVSTGDTEICAPDVPSVTPAPPAGRCNTGSTHHHSVAISMQRQWPAAIHTGLHGNGMDRLAP